MSYEYIYLYKMNKHFIIEQLKKIKPVLTKKYGVTELALFGSYSRNEETEKSDIDILVNYSHPMGMKSLILSMNWKMCLKKKAFRSYHEKGLNQNISSVNRI